MARLETTADAPVPVRVVAQKIGEWINRLGEVWIEGQIAQLSRRPGVNTQFLTLRDTDASISLTVTCARGVLPDSIEEGSRVVLRARPDYYIERGTLSLRATEIRPVGLGELLAALERLKKLLAAEGLFAADRKRRPPFLPRQIGLVTGRASAAERDVVENVRRRMPTARFRIVNVAVQGASAVNEVVDAVERLDADPHVDVIVIARGGGSVEDLLPFSNESLLRAVAAARTPVISAIGHETDAPLLDLVADVAASTPTDAARRVVPDIAAQLGELHALRSRVRQAVQRRLSDESRLMAGLPERLRAVVHARLTRDAVAVADARDRTRRRTSAILTAASADVVHLSARVRSLSPQATLDRGYAVVTRHSDGMLVRDADQADSRLRVRVARGEFAADPLLGSDASTPVGSSTP
ncbi:MAG: exodeoxyribonuclease VII large subunit [Actinobacteria bacterium]|nr:exodeoxyribonuclease VII large subunit [Actinomycetota bacterium]